MKYTKFCINHIFLLLIYIISFTWFFWYNWWFYRFFWLFWNFWICWNVWFLWHFGFHWWRFYPFSSSFYNCAHLIIFIF